MNTRISALTVVCATMLIVSGAAAQDARSAPRRQGFWIGVGVGWGSATYLSGGVTERLSGVSGNLRLGGTLGHHILLGAETNGWHHSESGVSQSLGALSGNLYFYPKATGTVYMKGGAGRLSRNGSSSLGVNVGAGIDLYTGRTFSLSPYANYLAALTTDDPGVGRPTLFQVGVAAVWH